ncbi:hypothetical protein FA10DRAFT_287628 [Acaromyces ingoldii]|uniref:DUF1772-domain-containing protein n=1 Tax=Acaromyces ingoldii TaxID=215250 RepID=A0A316YHH8_9BASI|nr:hypothetical protein FA10DRAFT_287628 [Acaromyces ingoldii]PWN88068.1 hypothetical protein FA10DRAFT_287628 [Acaromyces ingoldii]
MSTYKILTGVGLTASSFALYSNVGASVFGVMPLILSPQSKKQAKLDTEQSVYLWDFFFSRAAGPLVGAFAISASSYLAASFYVPSFVLLDKNSPITNVKQLKWILRAAAGLSIAPLPFTIAFIFPSIKSLQTYVKNKRGEATIEPKGSDSATVHIDDNTAEKKIEEWNFFHLFRYGFFTTSWLLGMVAFST